MKINEILKTLIKQKGLLQTNYASRLGLTKQSLYIRLNQENLGMELAKTMLNELDYKIVIMPKEGRLPKDSYEVE